ncbi:MAG TPA: glycosyltransferase family 1 protein [Acidimicrobiales bacterium]|nr:glycosyltransferase family 1 protein [Acidimicrobiales bacterium]
MLRIGFDGTPLLGKKTGVGWYTHELIDAVARLSPSSELVVFPISWRTARSLHLDPPHRPNVKVARRLAPARPLWALWDRVPFPPVEWLVGCNVFHATNFISPPSRRIPTVVTVHDIGFIRDPESVTPAIRRMARLLPTVLKRASIIVTVSDFTRDELAWWMPEISERIRVIPNGSHGRLIPQAGSGAPRINDAPYALMLGTLEPRKNVQLALDALAILRKEGSDLRLVLAGAASPVLDVPPLIEERGLGSSDVTITGYVDDARMAELVAGATMLVFPSLYEGFGMPLIEAMEAGLPVVGVRAGATPETVGDAGVLVDPGDAAEFADAMQRVATDDGLRADLIAAGHRQAAKFTWDRAGADALRLYRDLANS